MPMIIAQRQSRLSFRAVRTLWAMAVMVIGVLSGAVFGPVTIIMAFTLGSVIAWVSRKIHQYFPL